MIEEHHDSEQFLSVEHSASEHSPLDLAFRLRPQARPATSRFCGPGIYTLSYRREVIYLGKYQPVGQNGSVFEMRWLRHFETVSLRGRRVGFGGGKDIEICFKRIIQQVQHPNLRLAIERLYVNCGRKRFCDTGVRTAKNRIAFADENWDFLSTVHDNRLLRPFEFRMFKLRGDFSQEAAANAVSTIEKMVLHEIKPRCNTEFIEALHGPARKNNRIERVADSIQRYTRDLIKTEIERCTVLG